MNDNSNETTIYVSPESGETRRARKERSLEELSQLQEKLEQLRLLTETETPPPATPRPCEFVERNDQPPKPPGRSSENSDWWDEVRARSISWAKDGNWAYTGHGSECECCKWPRNGQTLILWDGLYYFPSQSFLLFGCHIGIIEQNHLGQWRYTTDPSLCTYVSSFKKQKDVGIRSWN